MRWGGFGSGLAPFASMALAPSLAAAMLESSKAALARSVDPTLAPYAQRYTPIREGQNISLPLSDALGADSESVVERTREAQLPWM